jgi:hypothetical protein
VRRWLWHWVRPWRHVRDCTLQARCARDEGLIGAARTPQNFTSTAVLDTLGSVMQNKYSEGYPGARYAVTHARMRSAA